MFFLARALFSRRGSADSDDTAAPDASGGVPLRVGAWNLGGLRRNGGWANQWMQCVALVDQAALDVLVCCETHLLPDEAAWVGTDAERTVDVHKPTYTRPAEQVHAREVRRIGGVVVLVRRGLQSEVVATSTNHDWCVVKVTPNLAAAPLYVGAVYNPPSGCDWPIGPDGRPATAAEMRDVSIREVTELIATCQQLTAVDGGVAVCIGDWNADRERGARGDNGNSAKMWRAVEGVFDASAPGVTVRAPSRPTYHEVHDGVVTRTAILDWAALPGHSAQRCGDVRRWIRAPQHSDHVPIYVTARLPAAGPCTAAAVPTQTRGGGPGHQYYPHTGLRWGAFRDRLADSAPNWIATAPLESLPGRWEQRRLDALDHAGIAGHRSEDIWPQRPRRLEALRREANRANRRWHNERRRGADAAYVARLASIRNAARRALRKALASFSTRSMRHLLERTERQRRFSPYEFHRTMQRILRPLGTGHSSTAVRPNGARSDDEVVAVVTERLRALYGAPAVAPANVPPHLRPATLRAYVRQRYQEAITDLDGNTAAARALNAPISATELAAARRWLRATSSTAGRVTAADTVRTGPCTGAVAPEDTHDAAVLSRITREGPIPSDMARARAALRHKRGDPTDVTNYRVLAISGALARLWQRVLLARATRVLVPSLTDETAGAIPGRNCAHHHLVAASLTARSAAAGRPLHVLFLDVRRAFASTDQNLLLARLWDAGVRGAVFARLVEIYDGAVLYSTSGRRAGPDVPVARGVREGDGLSALFFAAYMDLIVKTIRDIPGVVGVDVPGWSTGDVRLTVYVDDVRIVVSDAARIPDVCAALDRVTSLLRLDINTDRGKTESMTIVPPGVPAPAQPAVWRLGGRVVHEAKRYEYLGTREVPGGNAASWRAQVLRHQGGLEGLARSLRATGLRRLPGRLANAAWDSYVVPRLMFDAGVWAPPRAPGPFVVFQHEAMRLALGLGSRSWINNGVVTLLLGRVRGLADLWREARLGRLWSVIDAPAGSLLRCALTASLRVYRTQATSRLREEFWWHRTCALLGELGALDVADWLLANPDAPTAEQRRADLVVGRRRRTDLRCRIERRARERVRTEVWALRSMRLMLPWVRLLLDITPPRLDVSGSTVAAQRRAAPFLHDWLAPHDDVFVRSHFWAGWLGAVGHIAETSPGVRPCPLCRHPHVSMEHLVCLCPAVGACRRRVWSAVRAALPANVRSHVAADVDVPAAHGHLIAIVLGLPITGPSALRNVAAWRRAANGPDARSPYEPYFAAWRAVMPLLRAIREAGTPVTRAARLAAQAARRTDN